MSGSAIIGLGSRRGVGKDTIASYLVDQYEFVRLSFADPLRESAKALFGFNETQLLDRRLKEATEDFWGLSPRQGLTMLGDAVRGQFGEDFLIRRMRSRINDLLFKMPNARIVIADVRLKIEVDAILSWGGRVYRVDRDTGLHDQHRTETELRDYKDWAGILNNNGSMPDLFEQVDETIGVGF